MPVRRLVPATVAVRRLGPNGPRRVGSSLALVEEVPYVDTRLLAALDCRPLLRFLGMGAGGIATAVAMIGGVTVASAWLVAVGLSGQPNGPYAVSKSTLRSLALVQSAPVLINPAHIPQVIDVPVSKPAREVADAAPTQQAAIPFWGFGIPAAGAITSAPSPFPAVQSPRTAEGIPVPQARPSELARAPASQVETVTPAAAPRSEPKSLPREAALPPATKTPALPPTGSRIALYDISSHTVYLPDGRRLEAHSGIGERMDDPRYVRVKMRGPTPPNIYRLSLREKLFHGVQAIRLTPTDGGKMFGRDGMLAHTYMLGPSGQSNGCVSFKNYQTFLQAYLNGEVDRMVVVPHLSEAPAQLAEAMRDRMASAE